MQYYFKPIRELPTGRGFADFVFIPKKEYANEYPALVTELKWNKKRTDCSQPDKGKTISAVTFAIYWADSFDRYKL